LSYAPVALNEVPNLYRARPRWEVRIPESPVPKLTPTRSFRCQRPP